jgi:hypothetical protein
MSFLVVRRESDTILDRDSLAVSNYNVRQLFPRVGKQHETLVVRRKRIRSAASEIVQSNSTEETSA